MKNEVGHEANLTLYVLVLVRREIDLLVYSVNHYLLTPRSFKLAASRSTVHKNIGMRW